MESVQCREAKLTDQAALHDISKGIYHGTDYAANMFPKWLADENWIPYVAETTSGNVIGFLALNITENATRVTVRCSRVAELHRGKGVHTILLDFALLSIQEKFANIITVIQVKKSIAKVPLNYVVKNIFYVIVVRFPFGVHFTEVEGENSNELGQRETTIVYEKFSNLYESELWIRDMLPDGNIMTGTAVYNTRSLAFREYLDMQEDLMFVHTTREKMNETRDSDEKAVSVVDLYPREDQMGIVNNIVDLYGNDTNMMKSNALKAINLVSSKVEANSSKGFSVLMSFHSDTRQDMCKFIKELKTCEVVHEEELHVLEADIRNHPHQYQLSEINNKSLINKILLNAKT